MAAGLLAGLLAAAANAALWLEFSTTRAAPGTVVTATTIGSGAFADIPRGSPPVRVFLIRADHAGVTSPDDERLIPLGRLRVDAEGNGELQFTVPDVPPGDYTTLTHCAPCASFSGGRELLPTGLSGAFVISEGAGSRRGMPLPPVVLGAMGRAHRCGDARMARTMEPPETPRPRRDADFTRR